MMRIKLSLLILIGFSLFTSLTPVTVQAAGVCATAHLQQGKRELKDLPKLRVMTYNVENLFVHQGKHERISAVDFVRHSEPEEKPENKVKEIAKIIQEENPDVLVLEEVEGQEAMEGLNSRFFNSQYRTLMVKGNDTRDIAIGFYVKNDLNVKLELQSHSDMKWMDPVDKKEVPLFSRDLPALIVTVEGSDIPALVVLGNHAKSKRNRPGDPESNLMRTAQFEGIAEIVKEYNSKWGGKVPVILTGDFNTNVMEAKELTPLQGLLQDSFDLLKTPITKEDRITHTYHPADGARIVQQLDSVMVNQVLSSAVQAAHVYRYKDEDGDVRAIPETFDERSQNPSDHFPLVVDISVAPMLAH